MQPYINFGLGIRTTDMTDEDISNVEDSWDKNIDMYTEDSREGVVWIPDLHQGPWGEHTDMHTLNPDRQAPWCIDYEKIERYRTEYLLKLPEAIEGTMYEKYKDKIRFYVCTSEV